MNGFEKIEVAEIRTNREKTIKVQICKFQKTGTKRTFFTPEVDGKRINTTMFARKYSAVSLAKLYISNHN